MPLKLIQIKFQYERRVDIKTLFLAFQLRKAVCNEAFRCTIEFSMQIVTIGTISTNRRIWDINFNMVWAHNIFLHISLDDGNITRRLLEISSLDNSLEFYKDIFYKLPQLWQDFKKKSEI